MTEELQPLIDKIRKEAIEKAEQEADRILSEAREKAAAEVKGTEEKAAAMITQAEKDAEQFSARSIQTLEQAARDVLIRVGEGVERIFDELVRDAADDVLSMEALKDIVLKMAETYIDGENRERRVQWLVSPEDQKTLEEFFAGRLGRKMSGGMDVRADDRIGKGFQVSLVDQHVHHDFSRDAVAEALSHYLRPRLAEIVFRVAGKKEKDEKKEMKKK